MKRRHKASGRTVTIPLEEYEKMKSDIKDLSGTLEAQITVIEKLLDKNETLCRSIEEIKDKYFALWATMKN